MSLAIFFSLLLIASSPFVGFARDTIRSAFPTAFVRVIGAIVAVSMAVAVVGAVVRVRERRALRYAALVAALLLAAIFALFLRTGNPSVDVVEAFHVVEYGCVAWLFYRASRRFDDVSVFVVPLAAGLLVGTLDEWLQWFLPARIGELRDVLMDEAAIVCGLLFAVGVYSPPRFMRVLRPGSGRRAAAVVVLALVVFGLFFQTIHLGYEIDDMAIGVTFRSRYSTAELEAEGRLRTARWRDRPPLAQSRLAREDQWLAEVLWHVQRRNRAWTAGEAFAAWQENLILESYYGAALDVPTSVSPTGFRWPIEQRADVARRAARASGLYVSDAEPFPIYVWRAATFWMVWAGAIGGILVVLGAAVSEPPS